MTVTIEKPGVSCVLGFGLLALFRVTGFDQSQYRDRCLHGSRDPRFGKTMPVGEYEMLRGRETHFLAACYGREARQLGVAFSSASGESFLVTTDNGYRFIFENARRDRIQALPKGYAGLDDRFTQAPWWQFGVQAFGFEGLVFGEVV